MTNTACSLGRFRARLGSLGEEAVVVFEAIHIKASSYIMLTGISLWNLKSTGVLFGGTAKQFALKQSL